MKIADLVASPRLQPISFLPRPKIDSGYEPEAKRHHKNQYPFIPNAPHPMLTEAENNLPPAVVKQKFLSKKANEVIGSAVDVSKNTYAMMPSVVAPKTITYNDGYLSYMPIFCKPPVTPQATPQEKFKIFSIQPRPLPPVPIRHRSPVTSHVQERNAQLDTLATIASNRYDIIKSTPPRSKLKSEHFNNTAMYRCTHPYCGKEFPTRSRLERHSIVHTGMKPFKCLNSKCKRSFSRRDNMMQHYRSAACMRKKLNSTETTSPEEKNDKDRKTVSRSPPPFTDRNI